MFLKKHRPMWPVMVALHEQGKLDEVQELLFKERKPRHELYDLQADPHEVHNLAPLPQYQEMLQALSVRLDGWIADTGDQGLRGL